ncbi:MAG: hypothetical protein FWG17_07595 [Desulfovibrionaceae bacterium]|nr:hypothetical protein [Desulfovibrionaceae bacterium]
MKPGLPYLLICALLAWACSPVEERVIPEGSLRIALAPFSQPKTIADLLAGTLPPEVASVDPDLLARLDRNFDLLLAAHSDREFMDRDGSEACFRQVPGKNTRAAFRHWQRVGGCLKADLLIVPQLIAWQEEPASATLDIFLLDIVNSALLARSRYDARQTSMLRETPAEASKAEHSAVERLGLEAIYKAIRNFGL